MTYRKTAPFAGGKARIVARVTHGHAMPAVAALRASRQVTRFNR